MILFFTQCKHRAQKEREFGGDGYHNDDRGQQHVLPNPGRHSPVLRADLRTALPAAVGLPAAPRALPPSAAPLAAVPQLLLTDSIYEYDPRPQRTCVANKANLYEQAVATSLWRPQFAATREGSYVAPFFSSKALKIAQIRVTLIVRINKPKRSNI